MAAEVLVLGGGFAGLAAAGELARRRPPNVSVRLVDRCAHSVFSPVLPDLISNRIDAQSMLYPIAPHCERLNIAFTQASVERIHPEELRVETDGGSFSADAMIICLGCKTNYFGDQAAESHAIGLKSTEEGIRIRSGVLERANSVRPGGSRAAHVVVVGGGYTGFEVASHVAYLVHRSTGWPYAEVRSLLPIMILERGNQPLKGSSDQVRRWSLDMVNRFGIDVRTGCSAESFGDGNVMLSDGSRLENALTVWAAGVTPAAACASIDTPKTVGGRLVVDEFLRLPGRAGVFAAGDVAGPMPGGRAVPLRMAVQFSLSGGRRAARNALRALDGQPLRPFRAHDLGQVIPLAPGRGAGVILGRELQGQLPSFLHYAMCIARSWSWHHKLAVLGDLLGGGRK